MLSLVGVRLVHVVDGPAEDGRTDGRTGALEGGGFLLRGFRRRQKKNSLLANESYACTQRAQAVRIWMSISPVRVHVRVYVHVCVKVAARCAMRVRRFAPRSPLRLSVPVGDVVDRHRRECVDGPVESLGWSSERHGRK